MPSVEILSRKWVEVLATHDGRAVISMPAQCGKSKTAQWAIFWALLQDPSRRVMYGSYSLSLAKDTGYEVRRLVEDHGEPYGLRLARDRHDSGAWYLERVDGAPHSGRHECISPTGTATGVPCDLAIIDDAYSGEAEAHSEATTRHVLRWWESTVRLRLRPGSPVVAIGTRFAERKATTDGDLLSRFIEDDGWERINIPALADGAALDSLDGIEGARTDDGWLITTRGHTPETWQQLRVDVTERVWNSTAQGNPSVPDGNLFKRTQWNYVQPNQVPQLVTEVIACDLAETGLGHDAGILIGGRSADGHMYLLADLTAQLTQAQWARTLCLGLIRYEAHHILVERTLGMASSVGDAWALVLRQATALHAAGLDIGRAGALLAAAGDRVATDREQLKELVEIVDEVLAMPSTGPRVQSVTPRQSKRVRAEAVTGFWELGRAHIVGRLPLLEAEAQAWNPDASGKGGRSPNRVDVMAHLLTHLDTGRNSGAQLSRPGRPRGDGAERRVAATSVATMTPRMPGSVPVATLHGPTRGRRRRPEGLGDSPARQY